MYRMKRSTASVILDPYERKFDVFISSASPYPKEAKKKRIIHFFTIPEGKNFLLTLDNENSSNKKIWWNWWHGLFSSIFERLELLPSPWRVPWKKHIASNPHLLLTMLSISNRTNWFTRFVCLENIYCHFQNNSDKNYWWHPIFNKTIGLAVGTKVNSDSLFVCVWWNALVFLVFVSIKSCLFGQCTTIIIISSLIHIQSFLVP